MALDPGGASTLATSTLDLHASVNKVTYHSLKKYFYGTV